MCGIAGFIDQSGIRCGDWTILAQRMSDAIHHRGPDDGGVWVDASFGVGLAHRRLSILDLSSAGHQPMMSACGRYGIVFNGEIYNHLDLRRDMKVLSVSPLAGQEYPWRGHSDTETLLAGFGCWGIRATLEKAIGMFALAVWDREQRTLTLARDRLGKNPFIMAGKGVYFFWLRTEGAQSAPGLLWGNRPWGVEPLASTQLHPSTLFNLPRHSQATARYPHRISDGWSGDVSTGSSGAAGVLVSTAGNGKRIGSPLYRR